MDEKDQPATVRSQRPRSPRVPVEFSLEVEGQDKDGNSFHITAQAVKISRGGATIILDREVNVGTFVTLTPPFGANLRAEVNGAWTDPIDNRRCIGVKLLDPGGWFAE
ncbi:MAG TPA: PilZ domain-containing protein [Pyrinomonadaceae bacterium]|nr:PilZ domain-containing protein [Pyrinomonadaceae bacterium]